jgi:N-acetylglucosaminyl-diphospho-decaprenol L-rhamnosyltransferase
MNNLLTIVFSAYQSHDLLKKVLKKLPKIYKILIIENSRDKNLKISLEKKFKNVEVIIPSKNLGLAKSYNLGIKKAKTKYIFLNNPDLRIENKSISQLLNCAQKIKNFGIIAPVYKNEKIFKNYEIFSKKIKNKSSFFKKYGIFEVDLIDNSFFINKKKVGNNIFDENFFLYFETLDFCRNLKNKGKKLYVCNNIKYHHIGSKSVHKKYDKIVKLTRAFHYSWSKFYYYKKYNNYFYAIKKIIPNIIKSFKRMLIGLLTFDKNKFKIAFIEIIGILSAILFLKSFYRPKM